MLPALAQLENRKTIANGDMRTNTLGVGIAFLQSPARVLSLPAPRAAHLRSTRACPSPQQAAATLPSSLFSRHPDEKNAVRGRWPTRLAWRVKLPPTRTLSSRPQSRPRSLRAAEGWALPYSI